MAQLLAPGRALVTPSEVHALPCAIEFDGAAPVSKYFNPTILQSAEDPTLMEARFRGRRLQGRKVALPDATTALIISKCEGGGAGSGNGIMDSPDGGMDIASGNDWKVEGFANELHYWEHDEDPGLQNALVDNLEWLDLAHELHSI